MIMEVITFITFSLMIVTILSLMMNQLDICREFIEHSYHFNLFVS